MSLTIYKEYVMASSKVNPQFCNGLYSTNLIQLKILNYTYITPPVLYPHNVQTGNLIRNCP